MIPGWVTVATRCGRWTTGNLRRGRSEFFFSSPSFPFAADLAELFQCFWLRVKFSPRAAQNDISTLFRLWRFLIRNRRKKSVRAEGWAVWIRRMHFCFPCPWAVPWFLRKEFLVWIFNWRMTNHTDKSCWPFSLAFYSHWSHSSFYYFLERGLKNAVFWARTSVISQPMSTDLWFFFFL